MSFTLSGGKLITFICTVFITLNLMDHYNIANYTGYRLCGYSFMQNLTQPARHVASQILLIMQE